MTSKELKEVTASKLEQRFDQEVVVGSKKDKKKQEDEEEDKSAADASMSGSDIPVDAADEEEEEDDDDSSPEDMVLGATAKAAPGGGSASGSGSGSGSGGKTVKNKPAAAGDKKGVKKAVAKPLVVAKRKATEEDDDDDDGDDDESSADMKNSKDKKKTKKKPKDEEDDNDDNDDDDDSEKPAKKAAANKKDDAKPVVRVGGPIETKAFALLDGIFEDPETGTRTRVTIPITRIPAILGRTHDTEDTHFFGLGKKKALSRRQCRIYYRDSKGGRVGQWNEESQEMTYKNPAEVLKEEGDDANNPDKLMAAGGGKGVAEGKVSSSGFYVIEGLGKNRIMVHGTRVDQGHSAVLISGSPIRISSYMLYFLQPTDAIPKYKFLHKSEEAALVEGDDDKDMTILSKGGKDKDDSIIKKKKRKTPTLVPSSLVSSSSPTVAGSSKGGGGPKDDGPALKKIKTDKGGQTFQAELDDLPVETLLEKMTEAISKNEWERKHQLIGSTVSLHAVRYAAMDPKIQILALDGGVSRTNIMSWIENSDLFKEWVEQMLSKMEARSYQAAVTKSLLKAGFTRTGSSGRYIKWLLPKDIKVVVKASPKSSKSDLKKMGSVSVGGKKLKTASTGDEDEEEEDDEEEGEEEGGEERGEEEDGDEEEEGGEEEGDEEVGDEEEEEDDDDDDDKADGKLGSENDEESGESDYSDDDKLGKTKKARDDDDDEEDDDDDNSGSDLERTIVQDKTKEEDDDDDDDESV